MEKRGMPTWYLEYLKVLNNSSDINALLPIMSMYGSRYDHITEFGVRSGVSTKTWIACRPKTLITYDRNPAPEEIAVLAAEAGVHYQHRRASTELLWGIEPTQLLFIDTLHTYDQLRVELDRHCVYVSHHIIIHDTLTFGITGEDRKKPGLLQAIEEFMEVNTAWRVKEVYECSNGLTILERV